MERGNDPRPGEAQKDRSREPLIIRLEAGDEETTLPIGEIILTVLRRWRPIAALALAGLAVGAASTVFFDYVAQSSFRPHERDESLSSLSGLASQFGLSLPGLSLGGEGESLHFYGRLLRSREILTQLATTTFTAPADGEGGRPVTGNLLQLLEISGDDEQERLLNAVEELEDRVSVSLDLDARLVTLETRDSRPELAVLMNRRLLELANSFNLTQRQTQATAEREFVETRVEDAQSELGAAEAQMEEFLENNRTYESSPQLSFEAARLQRRIDLQQQVYTTLAQAYEQARIEEVRNTPVITIVDAPEGSAERDGDLVLNSLIGTAVGCLLGTLLVLGNTYLLPEAWWRKRRGSRITSAAPPPPRTLSRSHGP